MPNKLRLPILKTDEVLRILFKLGFQAKRKKGSHLILGKGRDIPRGTLNNIIKQTGLTKSGFLKILKK